MYHIPLNMYYIFDICVINFRGLISTVKHYAEAVTVAEHEYHRQIQKCFDSLEFIFKFVVQSEILFAKASHGLIEDSFQRDIQSLGTSVCEMLSNSSSDTFIHTQVGKRNNRHTISAYFWL